MCNSITVVLVYEPEIEAAEEQLRKVFYDGFKLRMDAPLHNYK